MAAAAEILFFNKRRGELDINGGTSADSEFAVQ
jgi:hypothetical protein